MKLQAPKKYVLAAILITGAFFRLYALGRGDAISDEVLYGFRAIGMLDFDFAVAQPGILQLFNTVAPWWTHLSFHDHPLLVFFLQHVFMGIFGVNLWGLRLSSAFFGIASIYLVYLIGEKLFSERAGLVAGLLLSCNVLMVYASRVAIQESQVIFCMLLVFYFFIRAQNNQKWYLACGAALGLGLLSKYTVGFIVLPLGLYTLLYRKEVFKQWWIYGAACITVLVCAPSILFNIFLYRQFGHFDFQLFYIFGQKVPYWSVAPGKDIGGWYDRFSGVGFNLWDYGSWAFAILVFSSLITSTRLFLKAEEQKKKAIALLMLTAFANILLYIAIGPSPRFLTLLIPWLTLIVGLCMEHLFQTKTFKLTAAFLFVFCAWEFFYAYQSVIAYQPKGEEVVAYSKIHWDSHAWGFNALDRWIMQKIDGKYPKLIIPYKYTFLEDVKSAAVRKAQDAGKQPASYLFVYNDDIASLASLWYLNRHALYESWPIITAESYEKALEKEGKDFYSKNGFTDLYVIQNTDQVLLRPAEQRTEYGDTLEKEMMNEGIPFESIKNSQGEEAFKIYHQTLAN